MTTGWAQASLYPGDGAPGAGAVILAAGRGRGYPGDGVRALVILAAGRAWAWLYPGDGAVGGGGGYLGAEARACMVILAMGRLWLSWRQGASVVILAARRGSDLS